MNGQARFRCDKDLLLIAEDILSESGYEHGWLAADDDAAVARRGRSSANGGTVAMNGQDMLLAENAYAVVVVVAATTVGGLVIAEQFVELQLRSRIAEADAGPKRWDAYAVLLTQDIPSGNGRDSGSSVFFDINYDTSHFRRLVRAGVKSTKRGVSEALTPFLEPDFRDAGLLDDPMESFSVALVDQGIDKSLASRAVEVYRQGGRLDDVL